MKQYVSVAALVAVFLGLLSYRVSADTGPNFVANLLLNIVAELLGISIGVLLGVRIASSLAAEKLEELAPRFVKVIQQLRIDGAITGPTARASVVCAVGLISEERLRRKRGTHAGMAMADCSVCQLSSDRTPDGHCAHCGLRGDLWSLGPQQQR